ncbi:MAG: ferritin family protein [Armatimonadota bacterium]
MDHPLFQAAEVLDIAIEIERKGLAFYRSCGAARASERVAEVFEYAAQQEQQHIQLFARMKRDLKQYTLPESYPGETLAYIDGLIGETAFATADEAACSAEAIEDVGEAIAMAVEMERQSIAFYSGLKQLVRASERPVIDDVIEEEHRHIRRLLALRREVEAGEG